MGLVFDGEFEDFEVFVDDVVEVVVQFVSENV